VSEGWREVRKMTKRLILVLLLAFVAVTSANVAWADVESDGTSIDNIQAP